MGWPAGEEAARFGDLDDSRRRWLGEHPRVQGEIMGDTVRMIKIPGYWAAEQFVAYCRRQLGFYLERTLPLLQCILQGEVVPYPTEAGEPEERQKGKEMEDARKEESRAKAAKKSGENSLAGSDEPSSPSSAAFASSLLFFHGCSSIHTTLPPASGPEDKEIE